MTDSSDICITKSCDWAKVKLVIIELNVVLAVFTAAALVFLGSCRRRSSNTVLDKIQWINYSAVTTLLTTYALGQMEGAPFRNALFGVWAMILLIIIGCADCFSAYSPTDNEQWKNFFVQAKVQSLLVAGTLILWTSYAFNTSVSKRAEWTFLVYALLLAANRTDERVKALKMATKSSLAHTTKYIADFMAKEHEISVDDGAPDPTQMKGYNYLVSGDIESKWIVTPPLYDYKLRVMANEDEEVVTLQKVWQCQGSLLTTENGQQLKDICLSFALFRLLCRTFGGHPFLESNHEKTWRFVRHGLLSEEGDYKRAFRVIEVELSFLFDLFYTKYAVIFNNGQGFSKGRLWEALSVPIICGILLVILNNYIPSSGDLNLVTTHGRSLDMLITGIIVVLIIFMEIAQILLMVVSDWATVLWICNYVRGISFLPHNDNYLTLRKRIIMLCQKLFKPWERKLGQYSLLVSFNRDPWIFKFQYLMGQFRKIMDIPRPGQKRSTQIKLPEVVKKAVILTLKRNSSRKLSNGEESLQQNGVWNDQLSWACGLETPTHVILVWHVATSLCMIASRPANSGNEYFIIASTLSAYCSYLVTFAPRLICDNVIVSELIFDEVIMEARKILQNCNSERDKYEKIMNLSEGETIMDRGAKLAKELQKLPNGRDFMWKVLADFWAELMLFLASSGDPIAHVEHLAKGGEFVTHLWALLSHAGILNHGQTSHDV